MIFKGFSAEKKLYPLIGITICLRVDNVFLPESFPNNKTFAPANTALDVVPNHSFPYQFFLNGNFKSVVSEEVL